MIAQAAEGLHHAHQAGLVHRDIKPANLLVMNDGQAKVLDFGLALLKDDAESEFSLAMIFGHDCLGTADYISPEQSLHSHDVDARADVYSLGCTLYFILTGQVPFPLNTVAEKLVAQRMKVPPPISTYVSDVPQGVIDLVAKMMAKKPEDRFQTAAEVAEALKPYAKQLPIPFDFQSILVARAREASRRMRANLKAKQCAIRKFFDHRTITPAARRRVRSRPVPWRASPPNACRTRSKPRSTCTGSGPPHRPPNPNRPNRWKRNAAAPPRCGPPSRRCPPPFPPCWCP